MSEINKMMLEDSKDLLDNVEVTTIAQECVRLKTKEDELVSLEEQVKNKKEEIDEISSRIIPELLAEQGLSAIKLADDIISVLDRKNKWELNKASESDSIEINAIRKENITGIHSITYDSPMDIIEISILLRAEKDLPWELFLLPNLSKIKRDISP